MSSKKKPIEEVLLMQNQSKIIASFKQVIWKTSTWQKSYSRWQKEKKLWWYDGERI